VELFLGDLLDGHGGRTFKVTATGKTTGVKVCLKKIITLKNIHKK